MSDQQTQLDASLDNWDVGGPAAAILELTSSVGALREPGELIYITSKDAFLWAGIAASLAETVTRGHRLSDIEITSAIYRSVSENRIRAATSTKSLPKFGLELTPDGLNFDTKETADLRQSVGTNILTLLIENLLGHGVTLPSFLVDSNDNIETGYTKCMEMDLISDPIIETTLGIAILGFIPFSFVKKTRKGHLVYRKIRSGLWKYEKQKNKDGDWETNVTFEATRIARAIKIGITHAYNDATKGESEEPVEI